MNTTIASNHCHRCGHIATVLINGQWTCSWCYADLLALLRAQAEGKKGE